MTEFKYYIGLEKHKVYLSAILDLYDRRIVSYVIRDNNNNALVFDTFDNAIASNPEARPLCHSDRGFQYTNRSLHNKLEAAGMTILGDYKKRTLLWEKIYESYSTCGHD